VQSLLAPFIAELGTVKEELGRERERREQAEQERDELKTRIEALEATKKDAPERRTSCTCTEFLNGYNGRGGPFGDGNREHGRGGPVPHAQQPQPAEFKTDEGLVLVDKLATPDMTMAHLIERLKTVEHLHQQNQHPDPTRERSRP
jgi:hypothetical protein